MPSLVKTWVWIAILMMLVLGRSVASAQEHQMMVRIAEVEIDPQYLEEYKAILREEAAASMRLEPGVLSIFPMSLKDTPTQVRILEIYASREAYESHLQTPHFLHYKTATQKMVKGLKLVEMDTIDAATMADIFKKMKQGE